MSFSIPYTIPEMPPAELLAELDAAAQAFDELTARATQLTLAIDEQSRRLRIELTREGTSLELNPRQLFALLGNT